MYGRLGQVMRYMYSSADKIPGLLFTLESAWLHFLEFQEHTVFSAYKFFLRNVCIKMKEKLIQIIVYEFFHIRKIQILF